MSTHKKYPGRIMSVKLIPAPQASETAACSEWPTNTHVFCAPTQSMFSVCYACLAPFSFACPLVNVRQSSHVQQATRDTVDTICWGPPDFLQWSHNDFPFNSSHRIAWSNHLSKGELPRL